MESRKKSMCDFVYGDCEAVKDPSKFVDIWITTDRNPCVVCGIVKSQCKFYKEMVVKGVFGEEKKPP
jgi:hypothetical protein